MTGLILAPFVFQGLAIFVDEFHFHRGRSLPRWERIGHPVDTLGLLISLAIPAFLDFNPRALALYSCLAAASCVLITKDEKIHSSHCQWMEHWLHAILFVLHPVVLIEAGWLWFMSDETMIPVLKLQTALVGAFLIYQITYWNFLWHPRLTN